MITATRTLARISLSIASVYAIYWVERRGIGCIVSLLKNHPEGALCHSVRSGGSSDLGAEWCDRVDETIRHGVGCWVGNKIKIEPPVFVTLCQRPKELRCVVEH